MDTTAAVTTPAAPPGPTAGVSRWRPADRFWAWARPLGGVGILAVLLWRLGTGPFLDGLRLIDGRALAAALGIGVLTTVCCAWRWSLVAGGLGSAAAAADRGRRLLPVGVPERDAARRRARRRAPRGAPRAGRRRRRPRRPRGGVGADRRPGRPARRRGGRAVRVPVAGAAVPAGRDRRSPWRAVLGAVLLARVAAATRARPGGAGRCARRGADIRDGLLARRNWLRHRARVRRGRGRATWRRSWSPPAPRAPRRRCPGWCR